MSDFSTRNIVDYAMDGDAVKFRSELYGAIHDKVSAHIEAAKQQAAQNLITPAEEPVATTEPETIEPAATEEPADVAQS